MTQGQDVTARLAEHRRVRSAVEHAILSRATSVDGLTFEVQASLHSLELRRGGYVVLGDGSGTTRLGQITDLRTATMAGDQSDAGVPVHLRLAQGTGVIVEGDGLPFHDAEVRPAEAAEVADWTRRQQRGRGLVVGDYLLAPGVPATLVSSGLNRHTFMCGQSGSGKTYSLGLLLERVLAETSLRVVVLDPNSDYVGLPFVRDGADPDLAARYAAVPEQVAVWRNDPDAVHPLRLRLADLDPAAQAAVLALDPIRDREEYAALVDLLRGQRAGQPIISGIDELLGSQATGARQLGMRVANLGLLDWDVWSPTLPSLVREIREPTARCTVVDLGSLDTVQEQRVVAQAVLSALWETRMAKQPCLVVIDEAHNICPAEAPDPLTRLSVERAVQIAAEGRKYGLYMLTSTQRPNKVHPEVVSQCDNLVLMRMNSQADLGDLSRFFSFVPESLVRGATSFRMGEALVGGKILPQPAYVQMGERVSREGGADVPTTWAGGH